jgi:alpha-L-fucosidase 2
MPAAGDFEMMEPLCNMYARDLLPFFKFRTNKYLGHEGASIPECIYFWGAMFTETYGKQPFEERTDKLQASPWHKWEWVSGPELVTLLLDKYEYAGDEQFLRGTVLPAARELIGYFDQHYKTGDDGKLYMHPAQALETWWDCVNPMPELAGLHATTQRLPNERCSDEDDDDLRWADARSVDDLGPRVCAPRGRSLCVARGKR